MHGYTKEGGRREKHVEDELQGYVVKLLIDVASAVGSIYRRGKRRDVVELLSCYQTHILTKNERTTCCSGGFHVSVLGVSVLDRVQVKLAY